MAEQEIDNRVKIIAARTGLGERTVRRVLIADAQLTVEVMSK